MPRTLNSGGALDGEGVASLRDKATYSVRHGYRLVWLIYPAKRLVEVHTPGSDVALLLPGALRSGGDILPGFTLAVAALFRRERNGSWQRHPLVW